MPDSRLRIALIDTSPKGLHGSMERYAELVQRALESTAERGLEVDRVELALPNAVLSRLRSPLRNWIHHAWILAFARRRLRKTRSDVLHVLDGSHAYVVRHLPPSALVVTVHDVIPALQLAGKLGGKRPRKMARRLIVRALDGLQDADAIVSVSRNTAIDLSGVRRIDDTPVYVVGHAAPTPARQASYAGESSRRSGQSRHGRDYMLHVGHNAFYKNRAGAMRVFDRVRESCDVSLKMVGPAPGRDLRKLVQDLNIDESVEFVLSPDADTLADLYRHASLLLFPSLYEGFGWPPLEAMALGCPVVCSDAASLPEVVGDAALTCAADDIERMAAHCRAVLQNEALAGELIEKGLHRARRFSLEKMGTELLEVYERARERYAERAA